MQVNNYNSNTSFGIKIPTDIRTTILQNIPRNGYTKQVQKELRNNVMVHLKELEDIGSDKYILGIKQSTDTNQPVFVLQTIVNSKLQNKPIRTISKSHFLSKFLAINESIIEKTIEKFKTN